SSSLTGRSLRDGPWCAAAGTSLRGPAVVTDIYRATGGTTEDEQGSVAYPGVPPITTPGTETRPGPMPPPGLGATGWGRRLRTHIDEPFFRNAYALILNTGLNGLLGAGFWLLAARNYDDADVGRASAAL